MITMLPDADKEFQPLDLVRVRSDIPGVIVVNDGMMREYARLATAGPDNGGIFRISGAVGTHVLVLEDKDGGVRDRVAFRVTCRTVIDDEGGEFRELLNMLYWTMRGWGEGAHSARIDGKFYRYYVCWLRDHVHVLKGMRYFDHDLKTAIELYADFQREDGMIWDRLQQGTDEHMTWRDHEFARGGFIMPVDNHNYRFERIPVENDVEYLFVEGLYHTWQATGDTSWMKGLLEKAIKALRYSTTDPCRWSEKHQLLKRGYTIDTWDFQTAEDAAISGGPMLINPEQTRFGIMHGDNTGFAAACSYLAHMLDAVGRRAEAEDFTRLGEEILGRLTEVSWNGEFFTHHVPEDPAVRRELGVDEKSQVSLSNAYNLNRGVGHEKCAAIIRTYQNIRGQMPKSSPGEFYQIYPPFERGFGTHNDKWEYMNGGVTTIVAGELARGAFEQGFEAYAADILRRVRQWGLKHDGYLHCCLRGAMPDEPKREFTCLDLACAANVDYYGAGADSVVGWTNEGENDLAAMPVGEQVFEGIPFRVIDPAQNRRRACIGLSTAEGYTAECSIEVGCRAASLYLLHTMAGRGLAGWLQWHYADGTHKTEYIQQGEHLNGWYLPTAPAVDRHARTKGCRVAWRGANACFGNVGVYVCGLDNPEPDKEITRIELHAAENNVKWMVQAITLSDHEVLFMPGDVSYGIPDNWGAAAVVCALVEGLAGVKGQGPGFAGAQINPRWAAAGVNRADVSVCLPASGGYRSYEYRKTPGAIELTIAASSPDTSVCVLLPENSSVSRVTCDGQDYDYEVKRVEGSSYACLELGSIAAHTVRIELNRCGE